MRFANEFVQEGASVTEDLHFLTIADAARRLEAKTLSPVELVEALLDRIESLNSQIDAFVTLMGKQALDAARGWLRPHFLNDDATITLSIHTFAVETAGMRVLVDTCVGNDKPRELPDWNMRRGPFLDDLEAAGFPPESFDRVVCTHLHVDHVGWNTRLENGRWAPTFPRARYLIGRAEWEFWREVEHPLGGDVVTDSIQPVFDAGLVDLVESDAKISDEVRLLPTPGHTPGHVSVVIESGGAEAVITGDMFHHPVQCAHPEWRDFFDTDDALAQKTRASFLSRYADRPVLILGTHFPAPTAGRIVRDGASYRFEV